MRAFPRLIGCLVAVFALCICIPGRLSAQGFGSINGTVTDASGAVVTGAEVTATQAATGFRRRRRQAARATSFSRFWRLRITPLPPKRLALSRSQRKAFHLRADNAVTVNITLKPGTTTETVTVNAETAQVDLTTGTISAGDRRGSGERSAPEWAQRGPAHRGGGRHHHRAHRSGGPGQYQDLPDGCCHLGQRHLRGPDQLHARRRQQRRRVHQRQHALPHARCRSGIQHSDQQLRAQYGQNAGGVVNIITKSGTNQYHGDLFEYVRNRALNAAPLVQLQHCDPQQDCRTRSSATSSAEQSAARWRFRTSSTPTRPSDFFGYQRTIFHGASNISSSTFLPTIAQAGANSSGGAPGTNNLVFTDCVADPLMPSAILPATMPNLHDAWILPTRGAAPPSARWQSVC